MRRALNEYQIIGLTTNLELHRRLFDSYRFFAGRVHTRFLEEHLSLPPASGDHHLVAALAAALLAHRRQVRSEEEQSSGHSPWKMLGQWELLQEWSPEPAQGWPQTHRP
jgi:acetyl/propionyl-CoA carboxylase alpha subunit